MCEEDVLRHVDEVWVVFKPPTAESCWAPAMVSQDFQTSTCTRSVVEVIDLTMPGNLNDHKLQRDRKDGIGTCQDFGAMPLKGSVSFSSFIMEISWSMVLVVLNSQTY